MKHLCCESATCNAGHSALEREAAILGRQRGATEEMRATACDEARGAVSRQLTVTPHVHAGTTRRYGIVYSLFACAACGHERIYGNNDVTWV
jgi:hypothetical protein